MKWIRWIIFFSLPSFVWGSGIYNPGGTSGSSSGGSGSVIEVFVGPTESSPTVSISANTNQFAGSVTGSTFTFNINPAMSTVAISTASLQTQITATGVSTGSLQGQINNIYTASTTFTNGLLAVGLTTATLQTGLNNVATSTNTLFSEFPVSVSTNVMGTLQAAQEPAHTGDVTNSGGSLNMTAAAAQTHITSISPASTLVLGSAGQAVQISSNAIIGPTTIYANVTPTLSAGTNITSITGTWPNQTINAATQGGTGSSFFLAVTTGPSTTYSNPAISSSSANTNLIFNQSQFNLTATNTTDYISLNSSSVTLQGPITAASLGALTANQTITLSADVTGSGATSIATTLAGTIGGAKTWTGSQTYTSSVTIAPGLVIGSPNNAITSTTTLTSTMTLVEVTPPAGGAYVTLTLPSASSNPGLDMMIYKVDATTIAVKIVGASTDLIEGTGTIRLDAKFQHASLHSLGSAGWGSGLGGIQYTPSWLGTQTDGATNSAVAAASDTHVCPFYNPVPVMVTGFRYFPVTSKGNVSFGIYDTFGNLVISTGPIVIGAAGLINVLTTATALPPGQYYSAIQISNPGASIGAGSPNGGNDSIYCSQTTATSMVLPNPYTFPGTASTREFNVKVLVAGGRTSL